MRSGAGLLAAARHAANIGCTTFQIMSGNPSAWNPGRLDTVEAAGFRRFTSANDLRPVFLHAGYLINLSCRSGRNAAIYAKSLILLQATLERAALLGCEFVVVHLGSRRGSGQRESYEALISGLARLAPVAESAAGIAGIEPETGALSEPMLLLENGAGCGECVGSTLEELSDILDLAEHAGVRQSLGICLDSAHMWGAGLDMTNAAALRRLLKQFDQQIGMSRLKLLHLNDSPLAHGCRRDRHEHLGKGVIAPAVLKVLARHTLMKDVPMILETPGSAQPTDEQRMDDLRQLAGL